MAEWLANKISPYAKGKTHRGEEYAFQTVYNRILHGGGSARRRRKHHVKKIKKVRTKHQKGRHSKRGGIIYKLAEQGIKVIQGLNKIMSTPSKLVYDPVQRIMVPKK